MRYKGFDLVAAGEMVLVKEVGHSRGLSFANFWREADAREAIDAGRIIPFGPDDWYEVDGLRIYPGRPGLSPTCSDYSKYLDRAEKRFHISRDEARERYGYFTYHQWEVLLDSGRRRKRGE
jgi:hypothetical protein